MSSKQKIHEGNYQDKCYYCTKTVGKTNLKLCSRCKMVRYCSKECQRAAWPTHRRRCNTDLIEALAKDPEQESLDTALSKWIMHWRGVIHTIAIAALDLDNYPEDRMATHIVLIEIAKRPNPPSQAQFFRMVGGEVMSRPKFLQEVLIDTRTPQKFIDEWVSDLRGNDTVQIAIICHEVDPDEREGQSEDERANRKGPLIRFLWFSLVRQRNTPPRMREKKRSRELAEHWEENLEWLIETGIQPSELTG